MSYFYSTLINAPDTVTIVTVTLKSNCRRFYFVENGQASTTGYVIQGVAQAGTDFVQMPAGWMIDMPIRETGTYQRGTVIFKFRATDASANFQLVELGG